MLRVHRFAAAIDMIAAGTRAPIPIAAKAMPANQCGNICVEQHRDDRVGVGLAGGGGDRLHAGGDRHVAQQRQQAEQQGVGRQRHHVALDHVAAPRRQHAGDRVRVEEQRQRRAERERRRSGAGLFASAAMPSAGGRAGGELPSAAPKIAYQPPSLGGKIDHRDQDHDVDQDVLDERDQRRRPQAGLVGVDGQDDERDDSGRCPAIRCR